eukprot:TRINITY_DN32899_c0_g1_i1.p1 TRINITY_DN32899_c0_g1~~TRINITY_DN32899_c0_g1_i1.p1  ORF type:complete len:1110 (-),score=97.44 TRINITY_DN32899_c0_g1_i1:611-3745(-)
MAPTAEEITSFINKQYQTEIVYFLDDNFEQLSYLLNTTVGEAVEQVAQSIQLHNYNTFSLFECRVSNKDKTSNGGEPIIEHIILDDAKYMSDVVYEIRNIRTAKEQHESKLLFKKRMFRETDESITESTFVNLSYIQAQHDFLEGNYPVIREDAAQFCALQISAKHGAGLLSDRDSSKFLECMEQYIIKQLWITRTREEWKQDVLKRYKSLQQHSKEDSQIQFLRLLRGLPYGGSVFFTVKKFEDPIGLLPGKVVLGINKRGIHFFRPVPKEYVHSAELRDIMQFGSSSQAVFFKMRVAGVLNVFQFETRHGEDICMALQTHINDVMMKRYSKANKLVLQQQQQSNGIISENGGNQQHLQPTPLTFGSGYEKQQQLLNSQIGQLKKELENAKIRESDMVQEFAKAREENTDLRERVLVFSSQLLEYQHKVEQMKIENEKLRQSLELATQVAQETAQDQVQIATSELMKLQEIVSKRTEELDYAERRNLEQEKQLIEMSTEKELLQKKLERLEEKQLYDQAEYQQKIANFEADANQHCVDILEKDKRIVDLEQQTQNLEMRNNELSLELEDIKKFQDEFEELQEFKRDYERKEKQNAAIIEQQGKKLETYEKLYKDEQLMRKQYWNMMEDMKGKIRVYARIRPLLSTESQTMALKVPDIFTIQHKWKDLQREYIFDTIFGPDSSQEQVFEDTKHLIQSAVDGYNVCIFAYGQTGSGKTFTIQGDRNNPGLTSRGVSELFNIIRRDNAKFQFLVRCYMLELYQDTLMDLLDPVEPTSDVMERRFDRNTNMTPQRMTPNKLTDKKIEIKHVKGREGWVEVYGVKQVEVTSEQQLMSCIEEGLTSRHVAQTKMNRESSRSHLITSIIIESVNLQTQIQTKGKLSFVDLAGSERVHKSGSIDDQSRLKEAQSINKSLSALGDVISALATEQGHIPYRNHKLTLLMSDSLGGNAKTLMFVNVSPSMSNLDESANSLAYAQRVKSIKNKPQKNEVNKYTQHLKREIEYWKEQAGLPVSQRDYVDLIDVSEGKSYPNNYINTPSNQIQQLSD